MSFSSRHTAVTGVTLLELVVVVGILAFIVIFMGVGFSSGEGKRLEAGQRILTHFLQTARMQAVLQPNAYSNAEEQAGAWLLIHDDPNDGERYRRYLGILYYDAGAGGWVAGSSGAILPKGVYVAEAWDASGQAHSVRVYLDYPRTAPDADLSQGGSRWIGYGFKPTGAFMHNGARIILGMGYYVPQTGPWKSRNPYARAGLAVWRSGAVSPL